MSNSYEKFVSNYHRYLRTGSSISEALKDADYAAGLWRCETEHEKALTVCAKVLAVVFAVLLITFMLYPALDLLGAR